MGTLSRYRFTDGGFPDSAPGESDSLIGEQARISHQQSTAMPNLPMPAASIAKRDKIISICDKYFFIIFFQAYTFAEYLPDVYQR
jgi:hypothetical protein